MSGRKRCTRMTAAPAGAGIAPGSGADELRGCTSPLCVRTQNPKPWYELPMSGDQISPPRRRPASADSAGLCGSTAARNKNAGQAGETAYALHRAHRKHKNTERRTPRAGYGRRQRRTFPAQRVPPRQFPVRTQTHSFQNTLSPLRFTAPTGSCAGSTEHQGFHKWGEVPASAGAAETKSTRP